MTEQFLIIIADYLLVLLREAGEVLLPTVVSAVDVVMRLRHSALVAASIGALV
jgi:hypothetical protein